MFYFQHELKKTDSKGQSITNKLINLHSGLHPRVRNHNLDLHPRWQKHMIVTHKSASELTEGDTPVLTYFRSQEQAELVERLIGKERSAMGGQVDAYRHPVIELRLTPDHFVVELIVSPLAWWDQQNIVGKLSFPQHRMNFRRLLKKLDADYRLGFWEGAELNDMHLSVGNLVQGRVLDEWMNTFCEEIDWLRIGRWYEHSDPQVDAKNIQTEAFNAVKALHDIYTFILWSSNNNFRSFYEKRNVRAYTRAYA
jgi:hypothetical protein